MQSRHLGSSGLKVTEISYGNWLTHGSQVEEDRARECVRAALDAGITTFDTADVYANTRAETAGNPAAEAMRLAMKKGIASSPMQSRESTKSRVNRRTGPRSRGGR